MNRQGLRGRLCKQPGSQTAAQTPAARWRISWSWRFCNKLLLRTDRRGFQRSSFWSFSSLLHLKSSSRFCLVLFAKRHWCLFTEELRLCYHSPVSCKWMRGSLWLFKKATRYLSCGHEGFLLRTAVIVKGVEALHLHIYIYSHVSKYLTGIDLHKIYLPTYTSTKLSTCLYTYLSTCQPSYLCVNLLTHLPV